MDQLSSHDHEDVEIPMPINSAYCGVLHGHDMTHHHHHVPSHIISPSSNNNGHTITNIIEEQQQQQQQQLVVEGYNGNFTEGKKKVVKYRECQKNHAATMGGNAIDGCGEFMESGEEGTLEALICSACNCHRNFHRKEVEGDKFQFYPPTTPQSTLNNNNARGRKVILGNVIPFSRSVPINMSYQVDHHHHGYGNGNGNGNGGVMVMRQHGINQVVKKRFRTKFSQEQKDKMLEFAEKIGWRFQKQEESLVQEFCQEIGVKRRVLKVWMHNNKHSLATKTNNLIHNDENNNNNSSSI